ncbi:hypothetical protein P872_18410 [Rhodonellum psychrophilum GCM71 = DSM 17998]|uniref:Uncharacterized protein n=2 Tax=Rhodonellum TaxID=336827 RepID=U5C0E4_9BACT|nr:MULTISPECIES: hypothetical protein [Rhodonellum]ERM82371.1 hypothetical protein P872_18410 [Rhodonellum psychrophilum GCM71 = DSM 17998]SDZ35328.1 hypothetical protein SAMN05444412_11137 [Rhodonellum ikkaensis]
MNTEIYNYILTTSKKIKCKQDIEDVASEVTLILLEKKLMDNELTEPLKNYIKGIIWNYSTTLYNQFRFDTDYIEDNINSHFEIVYDDSNDRMNEDNHIELSPVYVKSMKVIKQYVFDNYYIKRKRLTKWRVFYLNHLGYDYKFIMKRLNIKYQTCIEYKYQAQKEIKILFEI